MAAVIDLHTGQQVQQFEQDPARPQLRLVQGGRSSQALVARRTYLRRRLLVVVAAVALVLVLAQVLGAVAGSLAGAFDSPPPASAQVHVVRPGENLWTLAADLAPGVDRRVAVDDLLALNGDGPLRVGQELRLPASFD